MVTGSEVVGAADIEEVAETAVGDADTGLTLAELAIGMLDTETGALVIELGATGLDVEDEGPRLAEFAAGISEVGKAATGLALTGLLTGIPTGLEVTLAMGILDEGLDTGESLPTVDTGPAEIGALLTELGTLVLELGAIGLDVETGPPVLELGGTGIDVG